MSHTVHLPKQRDSSALSAKPTMETKDTLNKYSDEVSGLDFDNEDNSGTTPRQINSEAINRE